MNVKHGFLSLFAIATLSGAPGVQAAAAPDPTFGNNGQVVISLPGAAGVTCCGVFDAAIQGADKVVILATVSEGVNPGTGVTTGTSWALHRLDANGSIDLTFGNFGFAITHPLRFSSSRAMAIDSRGRIIVAGAATDCLDGGCGISLVLARYLRDGTLDPEFGVAGLSFSALPLRAAPSSVALQSDGKIVVLLDTTRNSGFLGIFPSMQLLRFDGLGARDADFHPVAGCASYPVSLSILGDGKILVTGSGQEFSGFSGYSDGNCAARLNSQGDLDATFGTKGIMKVRSESWSDAVVEARGSLLTTSDDKNLGTIQRLLSSGPSDFTFSDGSAAPGNQRVALGCNGLFLAATGHRGSIQLFRIASDGSADTTFGNDGLDQVAVYQGFPSYVLSLLVQPDGKIVTVSRDIDNQTPLQATVLRFTQDSCEVPATAQPATVIEFYNAILDHYFFTAFASEANALDAAPASGWKRTGQTFKAFGAPDATNASLSPLCRFYGSGSPGPNTHFFTARTDECGYLQKVQAATPATSPRFNFEGDAFWVSLQLNGACLASAPVGVYRLYNNGYALGKDPNLRFTTDPKIVSAMLAKGWVNEGIGFCTRN